MSLMDVAGIAAGGLAQGRMATVAVADMAFLRPVKVGDVIYCYALPQYTRALGGKTCTSLVRVRIFTSR